jgi:4'-phosphopantetheinyl transferase
VNDVLIERGRLAWAIATQGEVPPGDDWLGPRERAALARFRWPARRDSFRLGRYTAKRLLGDGGVELLPSPEGPPRAFAAAAAEPLPLSISLSHRAGLAACVAARGEVALGCDVELIEPRSRAFCCDFFTPGERAAVLSAPQPDVAANLIWSAKESALKALHVGLGRDPLGLEVSLGPGVLVVDDLVYRRALSGAWRRLGTRHLLTLVHGCRS